MHRVLVIAGLLIAVAGVARAADDGETGRVERGRYLARAADCAACHTAKGGTPYAGGRPIETPFGAVYGTNITPDTEYGIGDYSADDFYHVLTEGELPDGTQLYPAMPYTDYHDISRADSDALYAYFMNLDPVPVQPTQTDLAWPFSMRWTLNIWNWLFAPDDDKGDPPTDRGRYLVDTLGHCGACHTPRNAFGAVDDERRLQGAVIAGYEAPDLTPDALAARGWNAPDLTRFLRDGRSPQGSMYSEMYPVFHHSTRYLNDDDLDAMTHALLGDEPPAPQPLADTSKTMAGEGGQLYLDNCAGCHGGDGRGVAQVASTMPGNTTLRLDSPRNLVKVIHDGIAARSFGEFERVQAMPGFANRLNDHQIAELATWLRRRWGGKNGAVDAAAVNEIVGDTND